MNWIVKLLIQEIIQYVAKAIKDAIARQQKIKENKKEFEDIKREKSKAVRAARISDFLK